jgi:hypothetical protein
MKGTDKHAPIVDLVPASYDRCEEIVDGIKDADSIYVLDFSFSHEQFTRLLSKCTTVVWIDHHKSAIEKLDGSALSGLPGLRTPTRAACQLTWEYFYPQVEMPEAVKLIADRDAWIWAFGELTAEFHYGLSMHESDPQAGIWGALLGSSAAVAAGKVRADGRIAMRAIGQRFKDIRDKVAFDTTIDGHSARAMNIAIAGSAAFGAEGWATGALPDDVEICCQYYHDGRVFTISMYSKQGTVDVSELCRKRGGGGHAHAAGFTAIELPGFLWKG